MICSGTGGFDDNISEPQILDDGAVLAIGRKNNVSGIHHFTALRQSTPIVEAAPSTQLNGKFDANRFGTLAFTVRRRAR